MWVYLLFSTILTISYAQQQCDMYPGTISFDYEVEHDSDQWFSKYGYYGKSKYGNYKGGKVVYNSNNFFPQQANQFPIQQQQQQIPFQSAFPEPVANEPEPTTNEPTSTTEEPEPLPIWKIKFPRHAMHVKMGVVRDGRYEDDFELDQAVFDHENLTVFSSTTKTVDITEFDIQAEEWYLICVTLSVINGAETSCEHCTLEKACTGYSCDRMISLSKDTNRFTKDKGRLLYLTRDLPVNDAIAVTRLWYEPRDRRCAPSNIPEITQSAAEVKTTLKADTVSVVELENLRGDMEYRIEVDLKMKVSGVNDGKEVKLLNYLAKERNEIDRCDYVREFLVDM